MPPNSRRRFLHQAGTAALALPASMLAKHWAYAAPSAADTADRVRILVDTRRTIASLDRRLFGSFLENLGRAIYGGIFDPGSPLSDARGYRKDVLGEIRELGVPIIRYPGGNFVSGYNWLDGVGPVANRPRTLDKAWNTIQSNKFGTNEFMAWCKAVGTEPLMAVNLGTGTPEQAAALLEYCNVDGGTQWSDLRRKHGVAEPYKIKRWCLGNEMDGPWQIGHMSAAEYGTKAADAARQMRYVDSSVQLIACGSSGPALPTYLEWDREVLEQCYDYVDALSLHRYLTNTVEETGGDSSKFLALNLSMDRQIAESLAVCDLVRGHKRSAKKLWLSFDEWNVWYRARSGSQLNGGGKEAPHLLEEVYNLEDALLVGGMLNTLMRNANRVKLACLAQLVNVIAPIMTNERGMWRQTIFYPYSWALKFAQGSVLDVLVQSPTYEGGQPDPVPYVDAAGTLDPVTGKTALFLLNRDLVKARQVEILWEGEAPHQVLTSQVLTGNDLKAANTFESPQQVRPQTLDKPLAGAGGTTVELPPRSYTVLQMG
ncbi:MAG: alpha-N-arabinofuranosidase [Gammaproteobacteria bacterium]